MHHQISKMFIKRTFYCFNHLLKFINKKIKYTEHQVYDLEKYNLFFELNEQ